MPKLIDLTGQKFTRLTVTKRTKDYISPKGRKLPLWECVCTCGNTINVSSSDLKKKNHSTKSCGCLKKEKSTKRLTKHKDSKTKLYKMYYGMIKRCLNPKADNYKYYGERGIKVCSLWLNSYSNFSNWAKRNGYEEGLTIERVDNNKNYSPNNCKWIPHQEQSFNQRKKVTNTSGATGIGWHKTIGKWYASITYRGTRKHIGYYSSMQLAVTGRNKYIIDNNLPHKLSEDTYE